VGTPVPRVGMGVIPVQGGQGLAVVGGSDGSQLRPEVLLFRYDGSDFSLVNSEGRLSEPRRDAALASFGGPERFLLVGGYDSPDGVERSRRMLASSEQVSRGGTVRVEEGPQIFARSEPCAVSLPDGRVLTVGGLSSDGLGLASSPQGELLFPGLEGGAPGMLGLPLLERGRYQHTCTVLEDGSVLIAGGVEDDGFLKATLSDLLLYTPVPLD